MTDELLTEPTPTPAPAETEGEAATDDAIEPPSDTETPTEADAEAEAKPGDDEAEGEKAPEIVTINIDGTAYEVPKALEGRFMMRKDYTQKTQEVAEQRRTVEGDRTAVDADRQAFGQHVQTQHALIGEIADLRGVEQQLAQYDKVNWDQVRLNNPEQHEEHFPRFMLLRDQHQQLSNRVQAKQQEVTQEAERESAKRLNDARSYAAKEIPDWSPERETKIAEFAKSEGVSAEEIRSVAGNNPAVLKILNLAYLGKQFLDKQRAAAKPLPKTVTPITKVGGGGQASSGPADKQSMDAWMKARNQQAGRQ